MSSAGEVSLEKTLEDKVVLITGGGTGMGGATARLLAEMGAHPVVFGIEREPIEAVAAATGGLGHVGDAADTQAVGQAVAAATEKWGGIDALVTCAGGGGDGTLMDLEEDDWDFALRQNLRTAVVASRACMPSLIERRGSIVLVGSRASINSGPGMVGYAASKHAVIGLMRSMAIDYGPSGVRVNAVCPGLIRTPMGDRGAQFFAETQNTSLEGAYHDLTRSTPLGRPGEPTEVARVIGFLISEWASFLTGLALPIDGGSGCAESWFAVVGYGSGEPYVIPNMSGREGGAQ